MSTSIPRHTHVTIPPLESGDRLNRSEFERRYRARHEFETAELIEGTVYLSPPTRFTLHAEPHADIVSWLGYYKAMTPGVRLGDNATVRLDRDNEPQPDALLRLDEAYDGQSILDCDGYVEGPPEFVAEIAASSAAIDLGDKMHAYRRSGVREYLVWQVFDERIDWFVLQAEEYISLSSDEDGLLRSQVFPGLWLDRQAMVSGNMQQVMAVLQAGLASDSHRNFLASFA